MPESGLGCKDCGSSHWCDPHGTPPYSFLTQLRQRVGMRAIRSEMALYIVRMGSARVPTPFDTSSLTRSLIQPLKYSSGLSLPGQQTMWAGCARHDGVRHDRASQEMLRKGMEGGREESVRGGRMEGSGRGRCGAGLTGACDVEAISSVGRIVGHAVLSPCGIDRSCAWQDNHESHAHTDHYPQVRLLFPVGTMVHDDLVYTVALANGEVDVAPEAQHMRKLRVT